MFCMLISRSGASKKEDDGENVEQLEDENKVCPNTFPSISFILNCVRVEHLVEHDFTAPSGHGLDKSHLAYVCFGTQEHA